MLEKRDQIGGRAYLYEIDGFLLRRRADRAHSAVHVRGTLRPRWGASRRSRHPRAARPLLPRLRFAGREYSTSHADEEALEAEVVRRSPDDAAGFSLLRSRISRIFDVFYPYTERSMMRLPVMLRMLPFLLRHRAALGVSRLVDSLRARPLPPPRPVVPPAPHRRRPRPHARAVRAHRRVRAALGCALRRRRDRGPGCRTRRASSSASEARSSAARTSSASSSIRAHGDRCAHAERRGVRAADVVISNADPGFTYGTLVGDDTPARVRPGWTLTAAVAHRATQHVAARAVLRGGSHLARDAACAPQPAVHRRCRPRARRVFRRSRPRRSATDDAGRPVPLRPCADPDGLRALLRRDARRSTCWSPHRRSPRAPSAISDEAADIRRRRAPHSRRRIPARLVSSPCRRTRHRPDSFSGCAQHPARRRVLAAADPLPVRVVPPAQSLAERRRALPGRRGHASGRRQYPRCWHPERSQPTSSRSAHPCADARSRAAAGVVVSGCREALRGPRVRREPRGRTRRCPRAG